MTSIRKKSNENQSGMKGQQCPEGKRDKMIKTSCPFHLRPTREEKRANYGQLPRPQSEDQTH